MSQTITPAEIIEQVNEEELLAQFNEGSAPISEEVLELLAQYREDAKLIKKIKARQEAAKQLILEEMDRQHVNKFTEDGVVVVEDIHFVQDEWDKRAILLAFPQAAAFITKVARTRFDAKK